MHYKVIAITGEIVATAKSKSEAEQMAKIHCLSVDRVFEASDQEGWIGLGIGLSVMLFWLVWLVLQFSSEQLKLDWPALLASPGPTLFFIFVLPIVGGYSDCQGIQACPGVSACSTRTTTSVKVKGCSPPDLKETTACQG